MQHCKREIMVKSEGKNPMLPPSHTNYQTHCNPDEDTSGTGGRENDAKRKVQGRGGDDPGLPKREG